MIIAAILWYIPNNRTQDVTHLKKKMQIKIDSIVLQLYYRYKTYDVFFQ